MTTYNTREATYPIGTTGAQASFALDPLANPFNVGVAVYLLNDAVATFAIEASWDDPFNVSDADANWQTITDAPTDAAGYFAFTVPAQRIRINFSEATTTGPVLFQVLQGIGN